MTKDTGFRKIAGIENVMYSLHVFEQGDTSVAGYKKKSSRPYLPAVVFNKASLRSLTMKGYIQVFREYDGDKAISYVKLTKQGNLYCFREFVK